jgi:CHAT domain-containing protein
MTPTPRETDVSRVAVFEMQAKGRTNEALAYYVSKIGELEPRGPSVALLNAYLAAATAEEAKWNYEQGRDYAEKAVALADKIDLPPFYVRQMFLIQALDALATADGHLGKPLEGESAVRRGLKEAKSLLFTEGGWLWEAYMKEELATFVISHDSDEAIRLAREAVEAREGLLVWANRLASVVTPEALRLARRYAANDNELAARILLRADRADDAEPYVQRALTLARQYGFPDLEESSLLQQVSVEFSRKDYVDALATIQAAFALNKSRDPQDRNYIELFTDLGAALRHLGRPAEALAAFSEAMRRVEDFRAIFASARDRGAVFDYSVRPYYGAVLAALDRGRIEEGFAISERVRARAFLDVLGLKTLSRAQQPKLIAEESALRAQIEEVRGLPDTNEDRPRLLEAAREEYGHFLDSLQKADAEQASLRSVDTLTVPEVRKLLPNGAILLEYLVLPDETVVWLIDHSSIRVERIKITEKELRKQVTNFRQSIQRNLESATKTSAVQLGTLLLGILGNQSDTKRLIIVPHGVLHYLPFQALIRPGGHTLIESVEVTYMPNASVMRFIREKTRRDTRGLVLAVGNPDLHDKALDLPYAEDEANSLRSNNRDVRVLTRADAKRSEVIPLMPHARLVHFATHADIDGADPLGSAILLSPEDGNDGRIEVQEIYGWTLTSDLIVVSGCETGIGPVSQGDEVVSFTRAFMYAGSPSVITTLWRIDDRVSTLLMESFYLHRATGMDKAASLRAAQIETMRKFPGPFYWAAYQLTGAAN